MGDCRAKSDETGSDGDISTEKISAVLQPILDLSEAERQSFTSALNTILPEDIEILDQIFVDTSGIDGEHVANTGDSGFMDRDSCMSILTLAGYTEQSDVELAISDTSSAMLMACGHVIGAMTHLTMELLELVRACTPDVATALLPLLGKTLRGERDIAVENTQLLLDSNVGRDLVDQMNIQLGSDSASVPDEVPDTVDKIFCLLYALKGTSEIAELL